MDLLQVRFHVKINGADHQLTFKSGTSGIRADDSSSSGSGGRNRSGGDESRDARDRNKDTTTDDPMERSQSARNGNRPTVDSGDAAEPSTTSPAPRKRSQSPKPPRTPDSAASEIPVGGAGSNPRPVDPLRPEDMYDGLGGFAPPGLGPPVSREGEFSHFLRDCHAHYVDLEDDMARRGNPRHRRRPLAATVGSDEGLRKPRE